MRSILFPRYEGKYQIFLGLIYSFKFAVFVYMVYSSFIFSSNYEQMLFRNVDDNAMITSITYMQESLISFDFSSVFFKYDYAYGWLFWVTYALFSFPAFVLTQIYSSVQLFEMFHIVSNRVFSVVLIFITVNMIKKVILMILGDRGTKNKLVAEILSFSVLLFPSVGYWAGRVQPSALTAFLFVLTTILLLSHWYETEPKKFNFLGIALSRIDFSVIAFGALIGVKPTTLPLTPIFLTAYFLLRSKKRMAKMSLARHAAFGCVAATLAASPSVVVLPVKTLSKIFEIIVFFSRSSTQEEIKATNIFFRFNKGFILEGMGILGFVALLLMSMFLYLKSGFFPNNFLKKCLIVASAMPALLFYCLVITENVPMISVYLFPLIVTQVLLFPILMAQMVTRHDSIRLVFSVIFLILVSLNFYQNLAAPSNNNLAINSYVVDSNSTERKKMISAQEKLGLAIKSQRPLVILQSYRSPTILSDLRSDVETIYSFDNWEEFVGIDKVNYILLNDGDVAMLSAENQEIQFNIQRGRSLELRQGVDIINRLVVFNEFSEQKCKKIAYHLGNTLFFCQ